MRNQSTNHSESGPRGTTTSALVMALLAITGFGVAIAGLAPGAVAYYHGTDACDTTVSSGDSIQDAVDTAHIGETICVEAGTYDEDVTVDVQDLTLEGPNAGTPGDDARASEATVTGQIVLSANAVTFDGFDVSPPPAASNSEGEAVRVSNTPDAVTVKNNVVRDFTEDGAPEWEGIEAIVAFGGDASDPIQDVTIIQNLVHDVDGRDTKGGAAGVMIQGNVDGATVTDNVVRNVGLEDTTWAHGVLVTGTGNHGEDPQNVDIAGNELTSILSSPAANTLGVGIGIETGGPSYVIEDNDITNNELGIEVKAGADETVAEGNVISGNAVWGAINHDSPTLDASGNYWGSPLGPTHADNPLVPTGQTGDGISGDVAFTPWCLTPVCGVAVI